MCWHSGTWALADSAGGLGHKWDSEILEVQPGSAQPKPGWPLPNFLDPQSTHYRIKIKPERKTLSGGLNATPLWDVMGKLKVSNLDPEASWVLTWRNGAEIELLKQKAERRSGEERQRANRLTFGKLPWQWKCHVSYVCDKHVTCDMNVVHSIEPLKMNIFRSLAMFFSVGNVAW